MGRKPSDIKGKTFGRLTVIERDNTRVDKVYWICECICGNIRSIVSSDITRSTGGTKSCGCLAKDMMSKTMKRYNTYALNDEYGIGYTLKGEEFFFDIEDYDIIKDHCWSKHKQEGYIIASIHRKMIRMHRHVMNAKDGIIVDHINRVRHDNRKYNLITVTARENCINISIRKDNTSGVTGVNYHNRDKLWIARINIDGMSKEVARCENKQDAIDARLHYEKKYYGGASPNSNQVTIPLINPVEILD